MPWVSFLFLCFLLMALFFFASGFSRNGSGIESRNDLTKVLACI
jgi:hypothetical protein